MEAWFIVFISIILCLIIRAFFNLLFPSRSHPLPPGPSPIPIIGNYLFLRKSSFQLEPILRNLRAKYGPIITLIIGSRPSIFIADGSLAYQALVQNGAVFSNRPKPFTTSKILSSNQYTISSAFYGPTWRFLRRNLTSEMLQPNRIKSFSGIRRRVKDSLLDRLKSNSESGDSIKVIDHLQHAMFFVLLSMSVGEGLDDKLIMDIDNVQHSLVLNLRKFNFLNIWPRVTRILFRKRWEELFQIKKEQDEVLFPLIRSRMKAKEEKKKNKTQDDNNRNEVIVPYLDTLLDLELPDEKKRKLDEAELSTLCFEFLIAGTDSTASALQWILANLVKYSHIQRRLVEEIREVMAERVDKEVKEEDLNRLTYLKAVVLEGLRLHPPGHFVVPHAVLEDVVLNDYLIPKNGTVNFMVAEMGRDPKVWEDPMEFKPERFLNCEKGESLDMTGTKEIKMMPFGVGRRICPGFNLAMFHFEYLGANLIWSFEWESPSGDVDLSEKETLTTMMKYPLQVYSSPRI